MKFRRRRPTVLIAVFTALLIGIAALVYSQRSNLHALLISMRYSEEELISLQEQELSDLLKEYGLESFTSPGSSPDSTVVTPDTTSDGPEVPSSKREDSFTPPDSAEPSGVVPVVPDVISDAGKSPITEPDHSDTLPKDVQNLVYSLYTLQSQFVGKLEGLAASTRARFDALPPEQRNNSTRASMVKNTLSQAIALESQCDGRVDSLLRELRATLKKHGLSDSIADNAENYYANQKGLIKAEYMRKYNKYLK